MNIFEKISKERKDHGYYQKDYVRYSRHSRKMAKGIKRKEGGCQALYFLYLSENSVSKHFLSRKSKIARKNIKKAQKLSRKAEEAKKEVENSFFPYYRALELFYLQKFREARDQFVMSKESLGMAFLINNEIDEYIEYCSHKIGDVTTSKVKRFWNDIELSFDKEEEANLFFSGKVQSLGMENFDVSLKTHILKLERTKKKLLDLIKGGKGRVRCLFEKSKILLEETDSFVNFMNKNYIRSDFVLQLRSDIEELSDFFKILRFRDGGDMSNNEKIEAFETPKLFHEIQAFIDVCKQKSEIEVAVLRKRLMQELDARMCPPSTSLKMPFLPVFYDLAYDFIEYPNASSGTENVSKFISRIFSRNK